MKRYISLGTQCNVASALIEHELRDYSLPWDWLYIGQLSDIVTMLNSRNRVIIDHTHWERDPHDSTNYKNKLLVNTSSRHFYNESFSNHKYVTCLFERRTERLFQCFQSDERIHFIRDEQWYVHDPSMYRSRLDAFVAFFAAQFPKLEYVLIVILDSKNKPAFESFEYDTNHVRIVYVDSNGSTHWQRRVIPWKYVLCGDDDVEAVSIP